MKRPTSPSQRHWRFYKELNLWSKKPLKSKSKKEKSKNGRNNSGSITVGRKGGGNKRLYRILDDSRENQEGVVIGTEYDPYRTSFISRVYNYLSGEYFYILSPKKMLKGSVVESSTFKSKKVEVRLGNALYLKEIPSGSLVHNIGYVGGSKGAGSVGLYGPVGQYVRSAGGFGHLIEKKEGLGRLRLSSGEVRLIPLSSVCTLGSLSNEKFHLGCRGKAGRSRWLGNRPKVRGVAMNPVDHPHGGGEGKTSGGRRCSVTPWGKPTKGPKTSRSKNKMVVEKRKKKNG